jgi:DNA polymerase delta subunit 1
LSVRSLKLPGAYTSFFLRGDVHHSLISRLYNGNDIERSVLANYCIKDSMLPRKIMEKEIAIFRDVEMARCSGVLVRTLMEQGQQIKVISQIARKAREQDRVIHVIPEHLQVVLDENEKGYRGATVIEPDAGFYDCPVFTLDFASLYPSIMIAHNLCYTTIIQDEKKKAEFKARWPEVDSKGYHIYWTENENGDLFVSEKVVPGLLTLVLQDFLGKRKIAKKAMEAAELDGDYVTMQVMNARQLALKVSANSVYGFTGATRGRMPLLAIAATVTEVGRKMIAKTKQEVEEHFCKKNGFRFDAKVRYGGE